MALDLLGIRAEDERRRALVAQRNALARQVDPEAEQTPFRSGFSRVGAAIQNIPSNILGTPRAQTEFSPFSPGEGQQDEFEALRPLQQAALNAGSSEDFAAIIQNPDLFPDPAAPQALGFGESLPGRPSERFRQGVSVDPGGRQFIPGEGGAFSAQSPILSGAERLTKLDPGQTLAATPTQAAGQTRIVGEGVNPTIAKLDPTRFTIDSLARFSEGGGKNVRVLQERAEGEVVDLPTAKFKASQEDKLRSAFNAVAKPFQSISGKLRTFIGAYRGGAVTEEVKGLVDSMPSSARLDASPAADLAMVFSFMKVLDEESVVRESEQQTVRNARAIDDRLGSILERIFGGETLAPEQRSDLLLTMASVFGAKFQGYDQAVTQYRDAAVRNKLDPDNVVIDVLQDITSFVQQTSAEAQPATQAAAPTAPSDAAITASAAALGFNVDDMTDQQFAQATQHAQGAR